MTGTARGNSGAGSYHEQSAFKVLNGLVIEYAINSVMQLSCGDGNQLNLMQHPLYQGYDVSSVIIAKCRQLFKGDPAKEFRVMPEYITEKFDLTLSLDVIFHLVEEVPK